MTEEGGRLRVCRHSSAREEHGQLFNVEHEELCAVSCFVQFCTYHCVSELWIVLAATLSLRAAPYSVCKIQEPETVLTHPEICRTVNFHNPTVHCMATAAQDGHRKMVHRLFMAVLKFVQMAFALILILSIYLSFARSLTTVVSPEPFYYYVRCSFTTMGRALFRATRECFVNWKLFSSTSEHHTCFHWDGYFNCLLLFFIAIELEWSGARSVCVSCVSTWTTKRSFFWLPT